MENGLLREGTCYAFERVCHPFVTRLPREGPASPLHRLARCDHDNSFMDGMRTEVGTPSLALIGISSCEEATQCIRGLVCLLDGWSVMLSFLRQSKRTAAFQYGCRKKKYL